MILLIGNYPLDRQQSMQRFAMMMLLGLTAAGVSAELVQPFPFFGRFSYAGRFVGKWLAYLDKFVLFPRALAKKMRDRPAVVHICDHSNAMYASAIRDVPTVVTCHDMLAVRGALGEQTETPASATGKRLQRWILRGLENSTAVACVSRATLADAHRLIRCDHGKPTLEQITLGLSYPYRMLRPEEARARLAEIPALAANAQFALHVGSNLTRKNREGVLRIFAHCKDTWNGSLIFAGDPLSPALRSLAAELGVFDRIVEVPNASSELLEALYNCATALLFPSTFEGFGWPIAEAHACGCPVLCADREPMSEVAGDAGLLHSVEDEQGFAADLLRLTDPAERARWSAKALENAKRFSTARMIAEYTKVYRSLAPEA
ncbi:MAG TPA: glycosyltransferase family 1 protein [Chthoniobacterales bacterium]|nr:glycosyltransferase family 1 protein [Chthoniobacterales bacterium]